MALKDLFVGFCFVLFFSFYLWIFYMSRKPRNHIESYILYENLCVSPRKYTCILWEVFRLEFILCKLSQRSYLSALSLPGFVTLNKFIDLSLRFPRKEKHI